MSDNMFKKIAFNAAVFAAFAAVSAFSASTAKAETTGDTTAETELANYVTLELDFGSNVSAEDITAAKAKYDGVKYETCAAANVAYMALFGVTWEKGYLDKTDNAAPLANYTGTPGSVSEVRYYVHGAVSGFTSLESASNNKDSTIGGNHQIFRTSYSVIGVNGTDGSKAKITSGGIQAYVAGGYETFFTKSGKLTVDNIEFTTTTVSTTVGASAARGTVGDTANEVTSAEMEIKNCTFRGPLYVYDNFDNEGKMSYNIHDCVLEAAKGVSTSAYAIHAQCKGGNKLVIKDNKISGYPRGVNIENANINATIEGNEISVTDEGRSCIQLTLLAKADITGNTLALTGGNAFTLHEKLATLTTAAEITISANKVTGNGYLIYDDANAEGKELTSSTLNLTLAADNEIAATVDTTKGTKGGKTFEMSAIVNNTVQQGLGNEAVAQVGETKYWVLADAFAAAQSGDTVTLLADATADVEIAKDITLDLGGKTLTGTKTASKATLTIAAGVTATVKNGTVLGTDNAYYTIQNNGTATFEDLIATAGNASASMVDNWGTLAIKTGTYTGGLNVVKTEEGSTLDISGGTFTLNDAAANGYTAVIFTYGTTTISEGEFIQNATKKWSYPQVVMAGVVEGHASSVEVTGGTFKNNFSSSGAKIFHGYGKATSANFEVSGGSFNKKIAQGFCAAGYCPTTTKVNGLYTVADAIQVIAADGTTTTYNSLASAFAAAGSGATVKLLADLTETDAKGDAVPYIMTGVTFDLNGKTYTHYNYAHTFQGTGGVIKNGKIVCAPYGSDEGAANGSYALFIGYHVNDGGTHEKDATAETTSFTIENVEMTGGINISHATGVVLDNLTVNGTKYYAVWTEEGSSVTIKSGTYKTDAAVVAEDSKSLLNGESGTTMTVEGGTFYASDKLLVGVSGIVPSISGGTFDTAVDAKYCASGYMPTANADGTYGIADGIQVLNADKTVAGTYHSLATAFAAAGSGDTVKLLADVTELDPEGTTAKHITYNMAGVTLDLNGKTYSHYNMAHVFQGTGGVIKNGTMVCLDGGSYALHLGDEVLTDGFTVENVTMTGGVNVFDALGVVLKGLDIKAQKYYAVWLDQLAEVTVESGTYEAAENGNGQSLFSATYITSAEGDETFRSALTVNGGTFKVCDNAIFRDEGGALTINGGTFSGMGDSLKVIIDETKNGTFAIAGGKFGKDVKESGYLAEGLTTYEGTDGLYAVRLTKSEVVTVKTEETTDAGATEEKSVEVALPETVISKALEIAKVEGTADNAQKVAALSAKADNGNPVWVNIVAGIDSDKSVAVDAAQNADASTIEIAVPQINAEQAAAGFSIAYEVDEVSLATSDGKDTATEVKKGDVVSAPAIDVDNVETSAYFQVKVVLRQNGSTVATVPATNYIGVLKKTTKMTKTIVPVPWHSLADGGDISVSNVVKTANLTADDKLSVYDTAKKQYNVYTLKDDKTWEPAAVYVIDANGQVSESSSGTPDTMLVPRGSGVWLERSNTDTPIVTYGLASTAKQETQIAPAETKDGTTTPTWSLAAVPSTEAMSLAELAKPEDATKDAVIVPTEGAPMIYSVKDGAWGYDAAVSVKDANGNATGIIRIERKTDATLPAGTGFWYVNGGGEKKVNW